MKSPFPGMDPYMERRWSGIHNSLAIYARDQLTPALAGTGLRAEAEQRLIVESDSEPRRFIEPDVLVSTHPAGFETGQGEGGTAVVAVNPAVKPRPLRLVDDEPTTQVFLEIRNYRGGGDGEVVTVVEFVSPTNKKAGQGRTKFLQKRNEAFRGRINFVEIDLTRTGRRSLPGPVASFVPALEASYLAVVRRFNPERHWEIYPMPLREPLQPIALPLRQGDADVVLHLQPLVNRAHAAAAFEPFDYAGPLHPPLRAADADWSAGRLAAAGLKVDTEQEQPR